MPLKGLMLDDYMKGDQSLRTHLIGLTVGFLLTMTIIVGLFGINHRLKALIHARTDELTSTTSNFQRRL